MTTAAEWVAFLNARLDEDERDAAAWRGIYPSPVVFDDGSVALHVRQGGNAVIAYQYPHAAGYGDVASLREWASAANGWTRDRALREVAAKRAMLGLFVSAFGGVNVVIIAGTRTINGDWLLRQMAAVYSDHPDYPQD